MSLLPGSAISSGGYDINNSLRFRSSASAYITRTPASAGNRKTFTFSAWIKVGKILSSGSMDLLSSSVATNTNGWFRFAIDANNIIHVDTWGTDANSTAMFRDPSAWYHIVLTIDTTQATASDRSKLYVNGTQQTLSGSFIPQNTDLPINNTVVQTFGRYDYATTNYFDGYIAETYLIDGQALTPSSFGETDTTTGSWVPKAYTGTYGTNGFYLKFSDIATTSGSNAGLGKDFSGNANYWTTNNISVTAGTTYDAMTDSPTLTSATTANYCTLNPLLSSNNITFSSANLNVVCGASSGVYRTAGGTFGVSSGKWYWEGIFNNLTANPLIGVGDITQSKSTWESDTTTNAAFWYVSGSNGDKINGGGAGSAYGSSFTTSDICMVAIDMDSGKIWWGKNGTWFASGNPAAGTNAAFTNLTGTITAAVFGGSGSSGSNSYSVNFGQRPFAYTPPTGFNRLNTYNLPDSTIKKGNTVMDATIYSGNSTNNRSIVNEASFRPDLVWIKPRNNSDVHQLYDTIRGAGNNSELQSNSTAAEGSNNSEVYGYMSAFTSTGFTVTAGTDSTFPYALVNMTGRTYVGWQWQAGSSTVTNTNGTLSSQVRANPTAGFSVVTFTKTGTATVKTVGHGLGVAPSMIIAKVRNGVDNWPVYHISNGATFYQELNTMVGKSSGDPWGNTTPTSSVFSVKDNGTGTQVAYCWAEIAGYSKFSSYVGNGSADGPFVYTGFRPKLILLKTTNTGTLDNWYILDSIRNTYNVVDNWIVPNTTDAENNGGAVAFVDFVSNGFKVRNSGAFVNSSGVSYIYAAFAENPFKNANAR